MNMSIIGTIKRRVMKFRNVDSNTRMLLIRHRYGPVIMERASYPLRLVLALFLRFFLVAVKPVIHIRFGKLNSPSLGGLTISTELYLGGKAIRGHEKTPKDIFYRSDPSAYLVYPKARRASLICNYHLDSIIASKLTIFDGARHLDNLNRMFGTGYQDFAVPGAEAFDQHGDLEVFAPQIKLTEADEQRGRKELSNMGIEPDAPFVCFFSRDSNYMRHSRPRILPLYGDWNDSSFRNAKIENYVSTAEKLADMGYYSVRMGKFAESPITTCHPKVIDYAYKHHSDFLDVYLAAHCSFFLGQDSGMTALPAIFRRPIAFVNVFPLNDLHYTSTANSVTIPKKLYSRNLGRFLRFDEILSEPRLFGYPAKSDSTSRGYYERIGLEIHENSPEEIQGLTLEMEQRIRGVYEAQGDDEELQSEFLSILRSHGDKYPTGLEFDYSRIRIGSDFLRNNSDWLTR